jgi:putative N6-adenine-specific DNA methylase
MDIGTTFAIDGAVFNSGITHSMYAALKTKDAIADFFRSKYGKRPSVDTENPDVRINVHINKNYCTISLDSSGSSLHLRGYKVSLGNAPLGEVLAAGLIMLSGWNGKDILLDPMCGSGTILIEAAMIANNIPAGYYREKWGFEKWKDFDPALWRSIKEACQPPAEYMSKIVMGADISPLAMRVTRKNISNAGLESSISLHPTAFEKLKPPPGPVHILMNPPYGERIKSDDIIALYKSIGDTLKQNYKESEAWIISGDLRAIKFVGLRPSKKIKVFNGPIECRFMKYELYDGSKKNTGT